MTIIEVFLRAPPNRHKHAFEIAITSAGFHRESMICVLDITGGPARGRRFWLQTNQRLEIGRVSTADFSVPTDMHMSRRHLILEGTISSFRVRDVGSANGTFVNNAKVSTVELCNGDRIRAGETTFEVSVLDDDENPHSKDGLSFSRSQSSSSIGSMNVPVRIIDSLTDSDNTRRCSLPEVLRDPLKAGTIPDCSEGTVFQKAPWWCEHNFHATDVPGLLQQDADHSKRSLLPELVRRLESDYMLSVILDVERLGRFGKQQVGTMVEHGVVSWHSATVCSVLNNRSRDFQRMLESATTQDALILLGASRDLDPEWIGQIAAVASRPSQLAKLLCQPSSELSKRLLDTAEFVLFERDRSAALNLLVREPVESV